MGFTELNLTPGRRETDWVLNGFETEASTEITLKEAVPDYRYGIKSVTFCSAVSGKWIKLKNGNETLIGPFALNAFEPFIINFESSVYCDKGNALNLITEEDFGIWLCISGSTGPPIPAKTYNPSPADEEANVSTTADLTWESDNVSVTYNVYLGQNAQSMSLVSEQSELEYSPSLDEYRIYYWRVDEVLGSNTATGDTWTFST